jgi:fatty acid amide hydrolase 2
MPAFFCGVFGHKPSGGLVPSTGHYPVTENELQRYNCVGPLARRAEDLMPILRLIAGPDGREELCRADLILGDPATVALEGLRVVVVEENGVTPVADELRLAQRRAAEALRARGAVVETAGVEALRHSFEVWSAMLDAARGKPFSELLGNGKPFQAGRELLRWTVRRSPHTLPAIALAALEKLPALLPARARRALEIGRALKEELTSLVGTGVLLYPPYAEVAPRHYKPMWPPFNWVYTAILNVMEFAVTQVPLGLNDRGLPVGVQVAAPPGADHRTIAVALTLEQTFGGWVPPERM